MKRISRREKQAHTRRRGSVQDSFVQARSIHDHMLCLTPDAFVTVLAIEGMTYDLKSPEEQWLLNEQFQSMLAGLSYPIQILWRALPLNLQHYLDQFTFPADAAASEEIWSLLSTTHATFLQQLGSRRTLLKRAIYLVIRVDGSGKPQSRAQRLLKRRRRLSRAQQVEQARQELDLRSGEVMRHLATMNLFVRRLRGEQELTALYYSCLTPEKADRLPLPPEVIASIDRPIRAFQGDPSSWPIVLIEDETALIPMASLPREAKELAPSFSTLSDLVAPAAVTVMPTYLTVEREYTATLIVQNLPRTVSAGWLKPLADLDEPMDVSFHIQPLNSATMIQHFRRQNRGYRSSQLMAQGKGNDTDPDTKIARDDVSELLLRLASGEERMLNVSILVNIRGRTKQRLDERMARVQAVLGNLLVVAREALFEQDKAFRSCLPHAQNEVSSILLDSRSASTLFPFLSNSLFHEHGVLEGVTPQGDTVILDPWGEGMANANRFVVAPPGVGKSHGLKSTAYRHIVKSVCARQRNHEKDTLCPQVIAIDPEGEYVHATELFGGQVIRLSPGSAQHVNPFDLPKVHTQVGAFETEHNDRLLEQVQKLHTLLEIMLANRTPEGAVPLESGEKGFLDRALYETYRKFGITKDIKTHDRPVPLMRDLYEVLGNSEICGPDPSGLRQRLRRYVHGSLSGLFSGPTNVSLDRHVIDFDIQSLDTELRPVGLFLVSNFVWTQSRSSRVPRLLIVDEAATLMAYKSGTIFLEDLVRRARKHYLGVTVISQHASNFRESDIPANCATHVLMRQDATSLDLLQQMYKLSSREVQLLTRLPIGEALLLTSEKRLQIRFEASEIEHVLATTDQHEIAGWPERCRRDKEFAHLLHRLKLDNFLVAQENETDAGTTAPATAALLQEGHDPEPARASANHHQREIVLGEPS